MDLRGYKTIIGIILTILGLFGYGELISSDQVAQGIDLITQLVGLALTVYGNYKAHVEISAMGGYRPK